MFYKYRYQKKIIIYVVYSQKLVQGFVTQIFCNHIFFFCFSITLNKLFTENSNSVYCCSWTIVSFVCISCIWHFKILFSYIFLCSLLQYCEVFQFNSFVPISRVKCRKCSLKMKNYSNFVNSFELKYKVIPLFTFLNFHEISKNIYFFLPTVITCSHTIVKKKPTKFRLQFGVEINFFSSKRIISKFVNWKLKLFVW